MLPCAFDHCGRAGVTHGETLAGSPGDEQHPAGRAVQHRIPDEVRVAGVVRGCAHGDQPSAHALANVVVRFTGEVQLDAVREERAEGLPGLALQPHDRAPGGLALAELVTDRAAQARTDRPVGVGDLVLQLDRGPMSDRAERVGHQPVSESRLRLHDRQRATEAALAAEGTEQPREIHGVRSRERVPLTQQIAAADRLVQRPQPERREDPPHLFGHEHQVVHDHLGRPRELRAQVRSLRSDTDRARVEMTRTHHDAAFRQQRSGAEGVLVRSEERCDHNVAAGLEPAVHT